MADLEKSLDDAGLTNRSVREYVLHWAQFLGAERIEVVSASDDARLVAESLESGEIQPAGEGLYYSRSYSKDTARSEERTIVATSRPEDEGVYNNWRHSDEIRPVVEGHMKGAMAGKTMYVIPYLMSPPGSPLERFAAGVQVTDNRTVCLHMIRMARVGIDLINNLDDPDMFVRAVHVTGDLPNLGPGDRPRPAVLRHGGGRAHDPALRQLLRWQRPPRQDRPRPAPGRLRRVGLG